MSPPPSQPLVLPEQFGRYQIVRLLGEGGMGAVYLARDTRLEREVALKVCTVADSPKALERFRREAKAAAALSHPNLCPVYDYGDHHGIAFITMKFIDGPALNKWVTANPLDARGIGRLRYKLALAMQAAHEGGVIHRDLKPGNIAVDKKGEPVILDFGMARQMEARTRLTRLGAVSGTPTHMAPEQARGDNDSVGPATDVYALGVILYELLTDELPFIGPAEIVLAQVLSAKPKAPRQFNPEIPEALEAICLKALEKNPADRYPTMRALAEAVARAMRGLPGNSKPAPRHTPSLDGTAVTQAVVSGERTLPPPLPTTETRPRRTRKPVGDGNGQRFLQHNSLAVVPQPRQVLGLTY